MNHALDIILYVGGLPVRPLTWRDAALGGSESAGLAMGEALARLGHHVTVFCNTEQSVTTGQLEFHPLADFAPFVTAVPHDVLVVQRQPYLLTAPTAARLNVLWLHDQPTPLTADALCAASWNVDRCLVLSDYQKRAYERACGDLGDLYYVTRNGIDVRAFAELDDTQRPSDELIYAGRIERGLDVLLERIMPRIWSARPDIVLKLCTYECSDPRLAEFRRHIDALIARANEDGSRPRVRALGALSKRDLYREYARSSAYVYPTPSPAYPRIAEVSCISAMEAMAAGLPFVTSRVGALPETLPADAAVFVEGSPVSGGEAYGAAFANTVLELLANPARRAAIAARARAHAASLDWSRVAETWQERFWAWIDERNDDSSRLVHHFVAHSDTVAARAVARAMPDGPARDASEALVERERRALVGPARQAERIASPAAEAPTLDAIPASPRFAWLLAELQKRPHARRILDLGCADGGFQVVANNSLARDGLARDWVGLDLSDATIALARSTAAARSTCPDRHVFHSWTGSADELDELGGAFDLLMAFDVLECVPQPWDLMNQLERCLSPDTEVLITLPFGTWEAPPYQPGTEHVRAWHFDRHDLADMFGEKPAFEISVAPLGRAPRDGSSLGSWLVSYRVGTTPVRPIDLERHVRLQRPRETVSAVLMAGPRAEDTLHWCLRSVAEIADEIILVDNGMSNEARRIAAQYTVTVVAGVDPLEHGFEVPRNLGLARARMDWVLWLDTDERLVTPSAIVPFLRWNTLDGYSLAQHNFSCDVDGKNEYPVRLFRNNGRRTDDKFVRFVGLVHEGPETGVNAGLGRVSEIPNAPIAHVGYLNEAIRLGKVARNSPLLERDRARYPDRLVNVIVQMRDKIAQCKVAVEASGGVVDDRARTLCRETVALFRAAPVDRNVPPAMASAFVRSALEPYTTALTLLAEGVEVAWTTRGTGARPIELRARFADIDEAHRLAKVVLQECDPNMKQS